MVPTCPGCVTSTCSSSLDQVGGHVPLMLYVPGDDLLDGDVSSCDEPDQPEHADDDVLEDDQWRQALRVEG